MRKKYLLDTRGETLVETLAAVLICALALGLLAGGITAASRVNHQNAAADAAFYTDLNRAEGYQGAAAAGKATWEFRFPAGYVGTSLSPEEVDVEIFGEAGAFAAYRKVGSPP